MKEKIDATLKKLAAGTQNGKNLPIQPAESKNTSYDLPGDPNCPICHGVGYWRQDLPVGHPNFGKVQVCSCRTAQVSKQVYDRLYELSNLDRLKNLTFENFKPRGQVGTTRYYAESLERAHNSALQFAQKQAGWLLLEGGYGCGKTHLAAAIANFAVGIGVPTLFITVPDLLDLLRFAYGDPEESFENRFDQIRNANLLILDDFGTQNATPWAQEKLFQIINFRYINKLPLVITTNLPLDDIDERIASRLQDPELVSRVRIEAPDYRNPIGDFGGIELLSSWHLHTEQTFGSFELRREEELDADTLQGLKRALDMALEFARKPQGWLVFTGPYGCGKTHLAAAIANYQLEIGRPPLFVVVPDLMDYLRAAFGPNSTVSLDRRFEDIRNASLLILDDLGSQAPTPWVKEKLYQLLNYRYNLKLPTVLTTPKFREEMDPRILSRLEDARLCTIISITAPSYRGVVSADKKPSRKRTSKRN